MKRFAWGIVVGFILGFLSFADPGGVRTAVVTELRSLFNVAPAEEAEQAEEDTEKPRTRKGKWTDETPPIIVP